MLHLIEALNSVALSHDEDCDCVVCRAADGYQDAVDTVVAMLDARQDGES